MDPSALGLINNSNFNLFLFFTIILSGFIFIHGLNILNIKYIQKILKDINYSQITITILYVIAGFFITIITIYIIANNLDLFVFPDKGDINLIIYLFLINCIIIYFIKIMLFIIIYFFSFFKQTNYNIKSIKVLGYKIIITKVDR